jgi:hypothetical protein
MADDKLIFTTFALLETLFFQTRLWDWKGRSREMKLTNV